MEAARCPRVVSCLYSNTTRTLRCSLDHSQHHGARVCTNFVGPRRAFTSGDQLVNSLGAILVMLAEVCRTEFHTYVQTSPRPNISPRSSLQLALTSNEDLLARPAHSKLFRSFSGGGGRSGDCLPSVPNCCWYRRKEIAVLLYARARWERKQAYTASHVVNDTPVELSDARTHQLGETMRQPIEQRVAVW